MLFHFEVKAGPRGAVDNHIAYITRKGSYSARDDLVATGHGNMPRVAENRPEVLWRAASRAERKNAAPFRAYTISLPDVLSIEQNVELAFELVRAISGPKPYQLAVHGAKSSLEGRWNPHVHAIVSDRMPDGIERPLEQMFKRYNATAPSRGGCRKDSGGRTPLQLRDHVIAQRRLIADITNATLCKHGHSVRVDHRTLAQQGKTRKAERYLGPGRIRTMSVEERTRYVSARNSERNKTSHVSGEGNIPIPRPPPSASQATV